LPDGSLDVACNACASSSRVIDAERVFAELRRGAPGAIATSLISAMPHRLASGAPAAVLPQSCSGQRQALRGGRYALRRR